MNFKYFAYKNLIFLLRCDLPVYGGLSLSVDPSAVTSQALLCIHTKGFNSTLGSGYWRAPTDLTKEDNLCLPFSLPAASSRAFHIG